MAKKSETTTNPALRFEFKPRKKVRGYRPGTKRAKTIELLSRPQGAKFEEIAAANKWDRCTAYEGIRLVATQVGLGLRTQADGRIKAYGGARH
jgi:hypothetical protein